MSIELALVVARWAHYAALTTLFGLALFPAYNGNLDTRPASRRTLVWLAVATAVSALAWGLAAVAEMAGAWSAVVDPATLGMIVQATPFGLIWSLRIAGALALIPVLGLGQRGPAPWIATGGAAALLASIALTGHTREETGLIGAVHILLDAVHLLAAGVWLGALTAFLSIMGRRALVAGIGRSLHDFAGVGALSVGALALSGAIDGALILHGVRPLLTTRYGWLLLVKIALAGGMVTLAATNRFRLAPVLAMDEQDVAVLARLRRRVLAEQLLGLAVLLVVALLGTMDPAQ